MSPRYVSINLLKVFAPFVRLEMLAWKPPDGCIEAFATQGWFAALENYGLLDADGKAAGAGGSMEVDDADQNLIPGLVEKVAVPRLLAWVTVGGWEPFSRASTTVAVTCLQELQEVFIPADKPAMQTICAAVLNRLQATATKLQTPRVTEAPGESVATAPAPVPSHKSSLNCT